MSLNSEIIFLEIQKRKSLKILVTPIPSQLKVMLIMKSNKIKLSQLQVVRNELRSLKRVILGIFVVSRKKLEGSLRSNMDKEMKFQGKF